MVIANRKITPPKSKRIPRLRLRTRPHPSSAALCPAVASSSLRRVTWTCTSEFIAGRSHSAAIYAVANLHHSVTQEITDAAISRLNLINALLVAKSTTEGTSCTNMSFRGTQPTYCRASDHRELYLTFEGRLLLYLTRLNKIDEQDALSLNHCYLYISKNIQNTRPLLI